MKYLLIVTVLFSLISCNADDTFDFYRSQHRSPELMGEWEGTHLQNGQKRYIKFDDDAFYYFSDTLNTNNYMKYVWYNDASKIYYINYGKYAHLDTPSISSYEFNDSKDTLFMYNSSSSPYRYIRLK